MSFPAGAIIIDLTQSGMRGPAADPAALNAAVGAAEGSASRADGDAAATAADRVQTGQDRTATAADRDAVHLDRIAADFDATATAADRVQTGQDRAATSADRAATNTDRLAADADAMATASDRAATAADRAQTVSDRAVTTSNAAAASASAQQAAAAAIANNTFLTAHASALPRGLSSITIGGTAITGATPGTYALTAVGGSVTGIAANLVVDTATTAHIVITNPGLNLTGGTTVPTFANPSGATLPGGTTLTAVLGPLIPTSGAYWAPTSDSLYLARWSNDGTATPAPVLNPDGSQVKMPIKGVTDALSAITGTQPLDTSDPHVVVTDSAGNILIDISSSLINHPQINTIVALLAQGATARAAVASDIGGPGVFLFEDSSGNIVMSVTPTDLLHPTLTAMLTRITANEAAVTQGAAARAVVDYAIGAPQVIIQDASGNMIGRITPDLIDHPDMARVKASVASAGRTTKPTGTPTSQSGRYRLLGSGAYLQVYGQSLSIGTGGAPFYTQPLSWAKMFAGGLYSRRSPIPDYATDPTGYAATMAVRHGSLVSMYEDTSEIGVVAMLTMIRQLLLAEDGIDIAAGGTTFTAASSGAGGQDSFYMLSDSLGYRLVNEDVTDMATLSNSAGLTTTPGAAIYIQGESDYSHGTSRAQHLINLRALQVKIKGTLSTAFGTDLPLPFLTYQTTSHLSTNFHRTVPDIALAQLAAAQNRDGLNADIHMACTTYFMPFGNDFVHFNAKGYDWMLAYFGLWLKRAWFDGIVVQPLAPRRAELVGQSIILTFDLDPGRQLKWGIGTDDGNVPLQDNYGFKVVDSSGNPLTISSVHLATDRVELRLSAVPASGWLVRYAWDNNDGSGEGKGNLRDDTGDVIRFDPINYNLPMHRWAPIFEQGALP